MKKSICMLLILVTGCIVEEVKDDNIPISLHATAKERGVEVAKKRPAEECFARFSAACENGDWPNAYVELAQRWKQNVPLELFRQNMEDVGHEHFTGAHIISTSTVQNTSGKKFLITTVNEKRNRTLFLLIPENGEWKIAGVKNLE